MPAALVAFAAQAHMQLLYRYDEIASTRANEVTGNLDKREALRRLLLNTGLVATYSSDDAVSIRPVSQSTGGSAPRSPPAQGQTTNGQSATPPQIAPTGPPAQSSQNESAENVALQEVIVTANKRPENIQDVPASITAFTAAALQTQAVWNTEDLQFHTPGLVISSNVEFNQPYLRGIGSDLLTIGEDSNVATYMDGIYVSRPVAMFQELLDVERVEVLKGPQGTLYGRNATGGVINIVTQEPSNELTETGVISYGSLNAVRAGATVSGPLTSSTSGLVSVMTSDRDGYVTDVYDGRHLESESVFAGRAALKFQLGDTGSLLLGGDLSRERDTRGQGFHVEEPGANATGILPTDPFQNSPDFPPETRIDTRGLRAALSWDLGAYQFISLTGYRESDFNVDIDLDDSNVPFATIAPEEEHADTLTEEMRISSDAKQPVSFVAGLYYLHEQSHALYNIFVLPASINTAPDGANTTNAYAAFGQLNWKLSDWFKFTLGGRESAERKSVTVETNFPPPTEVDKAARSWNAFTPHFGLELTPSDNELLYATASRGFKSGGFDALTRGAPEFNPEYIWAYEAGIKSSLLDKRMIANLAVFDYDYTNMQVTTIAPGGIISTVNNAAKSTIRGLEGQLQALLGGGLSADAGLSYLHARFDQYLTVNPSVDPNMTVDLAGNTLPRAPTIEANAGLQYETALGQGLGLLLRADGTYRSKTYFDVYDTQALSQGGFGLLNLSATLKKEIGGWRWSAKLFGRNVTDRIYATNAAQSGGFYGVVKWYDPRATFGIALRAEH